MSRRPASPSVRITPDGFRDLGEGGEYDNSFADIVIEDSIFDGSRGVGVFVDGYVTGGTLRDLRIEGAGISGIYLETGSKDTVVENRDIVGNRFEGHSYGSIFLYKNCGEYPDSGRWFEPRHHADGNVIEGNTFRNEDNGVWIAPRMGENTLPRECSDPQYRFGYVLDYAADNIIRDNTFEDVTFGVRVEDDRSTISGNHFAGDCSVDGKVTGAKKGISPIS